MTDDTRPLTIKFKRLRDDAILPTKGRPGDAAFDLYAPHRHSLLCGDVDVIPLGIAWECPPGWYAQILTRSSMAGAGCDVSAGCIDAGYRGEWKVVIHGHGDQRMRIEWGDRIAQFVILPVPAVIITEADTLNDTDRGTGGFGSTGR